MFIYEIGGKKYEQRPLVLGQIRQLMQAIKGVDLSNALSPTGLVAALGEQISEAIAIVLIPEGVALKDKHITTLAVELEFEMSPDMALQVVEDFFGCNPIASLLERLAGMANKITVQMTGSSKSASSSQTEILPDARQSSGDIP